MAWRDVEVGLGDLDPPLESNAGASGWWALRELGCVAEGCFCGTLTGFWIGFGFYPG